MLPEIWLMEKILNAFWTQSLGRIEAQIQIYSVGFKDILVVTYIYFVV